MLTNYFIVIDKNGTKRIIIRSGCRWEVAKTAAELGLSDEIIDRLESETDELIDLGDVDLG